MFLLLSWVLWLSFALWSSVCPCLLASLVLAHLAETPSSCLLLDLPVSLGVLVSFSHTPAFFSTLAPLNLFQEPHFSKVLSFYVQASGLSVTWGWDVLTAKKQKRNPEYSRPLSYSFKESPRKRPNLDLCNRLVKAISWYLGTHISSGWRWPALSTLRTSPKWGENNHITFNLRYMQQKWPKWQGYRKIEIPF